MRPALAVVSLALAACGPPAPKLSELEKDIFTPSCAYTACHAKAGAANGLDLQSAGSWGRLVDRRASVDGKTLVVPGRPAQSYLYERLTGSMPPGAPLEKAEVARVKAWIEAGAPND